MIAARTVAGMPKPLSSSEIEDQVRAAYEAGEDPAVIGGRFGVSAEAVEEIAAGAPVQTESGLQRRGNRIALAALIGIAPAAVIEVFGATLPATLVVWAACTAAAYALLSRGR